MLAAYRPAPSSDKENAKRNGSFSKQIICRDSDHFLFPKGWDIGVEFKAQGYTFFADYSALLICSYSLQCELRKLVPLRQPMASPLINPENMLAIDIIDAYKADRHNSLSPSLPSNQTDPDQEHKPPAGWSQSVYLAMTRICLSDLEDNARRERDTCTRTRFLPALFALW